MVPILPAITHLVSSGVNSVGNPFNMTRLQQLEANVTLTLEKRVVPGLRKCN